MIWRKNFKKTQRRGAVAVVVTLCLVPLIGVLAFAFDGGLMIAAKRRAQTVADASAHAAACQLYSNLGTDPTGLDVSGKARAAAFSNALANGFNDDGSTNTVQVNIPPTNLSKLWQLKPGYVEVVVVYNQSRIFGAVLGSGNMPISARAVARGTVGVSAIPTPYSNASVIALDPSAKASLSVSGGAFFTTQSTIQVNSSNATAALVTNGAYATAPSVQVVGNYHVDLGSLLYTTKDPAVKTAAPSVPDPLAQLKAPDPSTLVPQSFQSTYGSKTILPGVYNGGLSLGNGMNITMAPGVYYMKNGGFNVGGGVTINGNGVTIYMDNGGGQFSLQGGSNVTLTPATIGPYAGLVYFQDRNSTQSMQLGNGSSNSIAGTIYAPKATAVINGGSASRLGSQFVVGSLDVSNGAYLAINTTNDAKLGYVASGSTTPSLAIVE